VWLRTIPSRIANRLIGNITGVRLARLRLQPQDLPRAVIKQVRLYGEMHRFIPAWVSVRTAPSRIREEVVNHRARQHGESKYGISRTFRVHGGFAVGVFLPALPDPARPFLWPDRLGSAEGAGLLILAYLFAQKLLFAASIGTRPCCWWGCCWC
jgi:hypothetical protein